mmetsp:Transcript_39448/g.82754  ORF Transcript_39448/g.82754 Transcript_39448/m.82754 type:complete len:307 (+) Transcript_39448:345-1265(+)|eukprot:6192780-Pleurochrysis_carterae.AAC.1
MRALCTAAALLGRFALPKVAIRPAFQIVCLNRLLFDADECTIDSQGILTVELPSTDPRFRHVKDHLKLKEKETLRVGVIDGGVNDSAEATWVSSDAVDSKEALRLELGDRSLLDVPNVENCPKVDVLLAMPRPLQFARILPMLSSVGVGTIWLTGAKRVEKSYFSSHLLKEENADQLRAALVEGLVQAGDTVVPKFRFHRSLRHSLEDIRKAYASLENPAIKWLCHPLRIGDYDTLHAMRAPVERSSRILVAVGPERGWDEPKELELFADEDFQQVTLGPRTLRTDVATVSLLAVAHARLAELEEC